MSASNYSVVFRPWADSRDKAAGDRGLFRPWQDQPVDNIPSDHDHTYFSTALSLDQLDPLFVDALLYYCTLGGSILIPLFDEGAPPAAAGMRSGSGPVSNTVQSKEDEDDIFGMPRTYTASFCGSRPNRPTMISAKYKQKEERRKVLKISINKLKKIEDPESSLRRSVLINNTMRKLQRESREEKLVKQQSYRCFTTDLFKEDPLTTATTTTGPARTQDQLVDITNLPESTAEETPSNRCAAGRKRSFDEVDDCDVQDVLSQFYLPPTPRMVTSLDEDEDEDVNVVDLDTPEKRPRLDGMGPSAADRLRETAPVSCAATERRISDPSYSCGHASMFNELQSVVYHSLITSLET